jgi:hypothetical protein
MVRDSSIRDVVDYLEYDVDPEVWIKRLLRRIQNGSYEPDSPSRFPVAKANGFARTMTLPSVPDLCLYRALVDNFYQRLRRYEVKHAYFERTALDAAQRKAATEAQQEMRPEPGYPLTTRQQYLAWLKFDEYRQQLILDREHQFIVTTDIANYFDTILHSRLAESLHRAGAHPATVGLLFFLLERLSIRREHTESPRIGLPVDQFGCSRKLAHIFLFSHDRRMIDVVTEKAYVRWMDDQIIGTETRAAGLHVVGELSSSLARLYLTPSTAKTRILTIAEAKQHFHLEVNAELRKFDEALAEKRSKTQLTRKFKRAWKSAVKLEDQGEWEKILKWAYRIAARLDIKDFRKRALEDVLAHPQIAQRIADYMRATGSTADFVDFAEALWSHEEQVYTDVNITLFESFLRLEPTPKTQARIRAIASQVLSGKTKISSLRATSAIAPLVILRFGDGRSLSLLARTFTTKADELPQQTVRAAAIVYASFGSDRFGFVKRSAARILRHTLTDLVRFVDAVASYRDVPDRFKSRMAPRFDALTARSYLDMRGVIALRLLALSRAPRVRAWVKKKKAELLKQSLSAFDKRMIQRLIP